MILATPVILSAVDLEEPTVGDEVEITFAPAVLGMHKVLYRKVEGLAPWLEDPLIAAVSVGVPQSVVVDGLENGVLYEFIVIAETLPNDLSQPSAPLRRRPTDGLGSIEKRMVDELVSVLEAIKVGNGFKIDVDRVHRHAFVPEKLVDSVTLFLIEQNDTALRSCSQGNRNVVMHRKTVVVEAWSCRVGRCDEKGMDHEGKLLHAEVVRAAAAGKFDLSSKSLGGTHLRHSFSRTTEDSQWAGSETTMTFDYAHHHDNPDTC